MHDKFVDKKNGELIATCQQNLNNNDIQKRNLELWKRDFDKATKIPSELVEQLSRQSAFTEHKWEEAKHKSEFKLIQNDLQKLVDLTKKKAQFLDPTKDPYDVMLDLYEPSITSKEIDEYFNPLKEAVIKIVKKCTNSKNQGNPALLQQEVTQAQQLQLAQFAIEFLGLDPKRSRLDLSEHPFTTGYGDDVRITTHYLDKDPFASFSSVFHEAGHALYELNLPKEHLWTALGSTVSMGIHESQSRFCENIIGKNPYFLEYLIPKLNSIVPAFKSLKFDEINRAINAVIPSKVRIYADEVTYNIHIILRYEIERDLMHDKINLNELPTVWNQKMEQFLGQKIENDREGVLQDTHWYGGAIGYFPAYVLGNIYNGQMWASIKKVQPNWQNSLKTGQFGPIRDWLKINVHQMGFWYDPVDLIKKITGEKPNAQYFINYLNEKFTSVFGI
jgi:carboxypeptidase Taq